MHINSFSQSHGISRSLKAFAALACASVALSAAAQSGGAYKVTNIISDGSVPAITIDPNFIDPWGMSTSGNWWISTNVTGYNYVVPSTGVIAFKVIVPAASGLTTATGQPTGSVTTGGATGMILPNATKASFLFSTLDGTISGWNNKLGTANAISQMVVNNSATNAVYTGLALVNNSLGSYVLAPNFGAGKTIEVYDNTFKPAKLTGSFTDPNLPTNYAPYAIHVINNLIYVTYTVRSTTTYQETLAPGNGIVNVFDNVGNFVSRIATGGNLNAPWGVAIAPANFGIFSNDILIGNFGDGIINVYDPKTFAFLGQVLDATGKPLAYASLWELLPGGTTVTGSTGVSSGDPSTVYFSAGLTNEAHGLVAGIANDSTTAGTPAFGIFSSNPNTTVTAGSSTQVSLAVAPTYKFAGTVTLACTGLSAGVTCTFAPSTLTVSPTAPATGTVTIQTSKYNASLQPQHLRGTIAAGITSALLLPFTSLLALRRRRQSIRLLGFVFALIAATGILTGCATYTPQVSTPIGNSQVIVTATGNGLTQQTTINLTVK